MNKRYLKFLVLGLSLPLSACGYALKEVYKGDAYNSPIFENNYYRVWDKGLKDVELVHEYKINKDTYFSSFDSEMFKAIDQEGSELTYEVDLANKEHPVETLYGQNRKLSKYSSTFSYGYISKLFDGQMFCNAHYQLARVQIDEQGFGRKFSKEGKGFDYFAINLKSSFDYTNTSNPAPNSILSEVDLTVNFYFKTSDGNRRFSVTMQDLKVPTNTGDGNRRKDYVFAGFDFSIINTDYLSRVYGMSISYKKNGITNSDGSDINPADKTEYEKLDHSLMLYEVFMPNTTWR